MIMRIISALVDILSSAVFMIPVFAVYNKLFFHSGKRTVLYIVFGLYFTTILGFVGFPSITTPFTIDLGINIIPFIDMFADFTNACLNILLFIPFGFFLPILWNKFRCRKSAVRMSLLTSCVIEISQIFTFRTTDINDLLTNTAGTIIGYSAAKWLTGSFTKHIVSDSKIRDFYILCASAVLIKFLLQPVVSSFLWEMIL